MSVRIHPTAIIEAGVKIGAGSAIWDHVHIRHGARIGEECIVGGKTTIAYDVQIGSRVKINSSVYICTGVTIEDGVMVSAGTIFTNDRFPRAATPDLKRLRPSEPDEQTLPTLVRAGATIGAGCIVGNDLAIGRFAMVGMGSVVTRSVPDFHLVVGQPARSAGCVCRCGRLLARFPEGQRSDFACLTCDDCGLRYRVESGAVIELCPPDARPLRFAELLNVFGLEEESTTARCPAPAARLSGDRGGC
jgi:acetyltransferase-like isoleucine patch superfamily enzyme